MLIEIAKILLSFILGSLIGIEREKHHKPVGLRTTSLICVGATYITIIILKYSPEEIARVLAAIITGLGFLGAGTIIANGKTIKGLTTAALVWVMALVGVGIGLGEYVLSLLTTGLFFVILMIKRKS